MTLRAPTLDATQLDELHGRGWTRVPGFLDPTATASIEDRVWAFLAGRGIERDNPSTWPEKVPKLQPLRRGDTFDAWLGPDLDAIADQLLGQGNWHDFNVRPAALVTMPTAAPWALPHKIWHLDLPARGHTDRLDAIRLFGLITTVGHHAGGTLVVEGSPTLLRRLVADEGGNAGRSSDARKALARRHRFFALLGRADGSERVEALTEGETVDGVPVRVAEITGDAGDLVVMDPWMIHNLNMNVSPAPRFAMSMMLYANDSRLFG